MRSEFKKCYYLVICIPLIGAVIFLILGIGILGSNEETTGKPIGIFLLWFGIELSRVVFLNLRSLSIDKSKIQILNIFKNQEKSFGVNSSIKFNKEKTNLFNNRIGSHQGIIIEFSDRYYFQMNRGQFKNFDQILRKIEEVGAIDSSLSKPLISTFGIIRIIVFASVLIIYLLTNF